MGFFPAVSPVLAGLDQRGLAANPEGWDAKVADAVRAFSSAYGNGALLERNRALIDYGALETQTAYVFMYVAGHADFLNQVLTMGEQRQALARLRKEEISVTSLGGGPGSDLLALIAFLKDLPADERPKRIRYRVLDKQPNWNEILQQVAVLQEGTFVIELEFQQLDVTVPDQWASVNCANDDLLMMNFFVSEVCRLREHASVRGCLESILRSLSSGGLVLFNDSAAWSFFSYFDDRVAASGGFRALVIDNGRLDAESDFDEYFRQCMVRFDRTPKLGSKAAFRIFERQ